MGLRHWQRRLATGANGLLVALFGLVALGLLVDVAERVGPRWDLSADGAATLAPQTRSALKRLEERGIDVRITAFSVQHSDALAPVRDRQLRDVLDLLQEASPRVQARFVDFDRDRFTAEQLGVDRYGAVVLQARGDRVDLQDRELFRRSGPRDARTVDFVGEGALVAALEQLLAADTRAVYALTGHGEVRPFDRGMGELHGLAEVLSTLGLRTRSLDLLATAGAPEVPADAAALLILGPTAALPPAEQEAIRAYLGRGGGVLVLLEPDHPVPGFVDAVGVLRPTGVVIDPRSLYPWEDRPLLGAGRHPATNGLVEGSLRVVVAHAAPLQVVPVEGARVTTLLSTTAQGWVERGSERPVRQDPEVDLPGPVTVAVAVAVGKGRMAVVGDLDWAADPLIDEGPGNRTFAAGLVRWLIRDGGRAGRVGSPRVARRVALTPAQLTRVRLLLVGLWPLAVLLFGLVLRRVRQRP